MKNIASSCSFDLLLAGIMIVIIICVVGSFDFSFGVDQGLT
jgi:hypothetical protein